MSCPEWHHVMPGITGCPIVHGNVLRSNAHNVVRAALAGPCQSYRAKRARWTGLMLRAAVTAVRGVSLKPIHSLSEVYAGVN